MEEEKISVSYPLVIKDIWLSDTDSLPYKELRPIRTTGIHITDDCNIQYIACIKKLSGDTIEMELIPRDWENYYSTKTTILKYSFFKGCLLDQALKRKNLKYEDLMYF